MRDLALLFRMKGLSLIWVRSAKVTLDGDAIMQFSERHITRQEPAPWSAAPMPDAQARKPVVMTMQAPSD